MCLSIFLGLVCDLSYHIFLSESREIRIFADLS